MLSSIAHRGNTWRTREQRESSDYQNGQAVRDGNLITANGTVTLEFTKEVLTAVKAYPIEYIESNDLFFPLGFIEILKKK